MKKPESQFWNRLKKHSTIPGHARRIENSSGSGEPDVNSCFEGHEFWVELKVCKTKSLNLRSLFEASQPPWHYKRVANGGKVFVLVLHGNKIILYRVKKMIDFDSRYCIIYEGESKNYRRLRKEFIKQAAE